MRDDVRFSLAIGIVLALTAWGCSGDGYPSGMMGMTAPSTANMSVVTIVGQKGMSSFEPNPAPFAQGALVVWRNLDAAMHRIVMNDGSFDSGNILLGGAGSDTITGGGGSDIIDGDAWLHVALSSYTAGASIIRQINFDPNGNTFLPAVLADDGTVLTPASGHINAANVDTAIFNDVMADYDVALFGPDGEGFLTIDHARVGAPVAGGVAEAGRAERIGSACVVAIHWRRDCRCQWIPR